MFDYPLLKVHWNIPVPISVHWNTQVPFILKYFRGKFHEILREK